MIFKKGTYIITQKHGSNHAQCVWLSEDFNPHTDKWIPYRNWYDVYYKPRTKDVVTDVYPVYDDENGGTLSFELSDDWHYAGKNVIGRITGELPEDKKTKRHTTLIRIEL